jgi:hypothetical protein
LVRGRWLSAKELRRAGGGNDKEAGTHGSNVCVVPIRVQLC